MLISMIIWINGPFGAGKTTLSLALKDYFEQSLSSSLQSAFIFDPELIGSFLRNLLNLSVEEDYQDSPLWRELVIHDLSLVQQHYPQNIIIVPMTLVHPDYMNEIFKRLTLLGLTLLHIWLEVSAEILQARISAQIFTEDKIRNREIARWRSSHISRGLAAQDYLPTETLRINGELSTTEVLHAVLAALTTI